MVESHEFEKFTNKKTMVKTANSDENKQPTRLLTVKVTYEKEMVIPLFDEDEKEISYNLTTPEGLAFVYANDELVDMFEHERISPDSFNITLEDIEDLQEERCMAR